MNILIVHAHHEPKSFSSALARQAEQTLVAEGHTVTFSDLYRTGFDPVSDRRNFTTVKDSKFLKQQQEEMHATENSGFVSDIESEIEALERCDLLIFSFPLWWFGLPAILKGWCDRVLAMGRIYGGSKLYEGGVGQATKRALVLLTTGGGPETYDGWSFNPPMTEILRPVHHGTFWFNGFLPLEPFIAWSPARIAQQERADYLERLSKRMQNIFQEEPIGYPTLAEYTAGPSRSRYFVTVPRSPELLAKTARLQHQGQLVERMVGNQEIFATVRAFDEQGARLLLPEATRVTELVNPRLLSS